MKKILFIAPMFYNYSLEIKKELEAQGNKVIYIQENKQSIYDKIVSKVSKVSKNKNRADNYFKLLLNNIENEIDIIFIIRGENISIEVMNFLKNKFKKARFIMYQWDSIINLKNFENIRIYFDKILTFDDIDAKHNSLIFQPLFYLSSFNKKISKEKEYDLYCVVDNHSDRYKILMKIYEQLKNYKIFFYLKASRIDQLFYTLIKKEITPGIDLKKCKFVYFKPLKKEENIKYMNSSKAILDIQFKNQNGLTIRTMETLITKTKLITTNYNIKNYNFYNSNNILVIDRNNPVIDLEFFNKPYLELKEEIYIQYNLNNWVKKVLE